MWSEMEENFYRWRFFTGYHGDWGGAPEGRVSVHFATKEQNVAKPVACTDSTLGSDVETGAEGKC